MRRKTKAAVRRVLWWVLVPTGVAGSIAASVRILVRRATDEVLARVEPGDPENAGAVASRDVWERLPHLPKVGVDMRVVGGVLIALAVVVVFLVVRRLTWGRPIPAPPTGGQRDSRRLFSDRDREWVYRCAGHRCEASILGFRCPATNDLQLDHFYPYAKGGPTDRSNLVLLCPYHNRVKTDHVPTVGMRAALVRRRRKYWPESQRRFLKPGDWSGGEDTLDSGE